MSQHITIKDAAARDLREQAEYLTQESGFRVAQRFSRSVEKALHLLVGMPTLGSVCEFEHPAARGIRLWSIREFPKHVIFYRPTAQGIDVVRVLHGSRDLDRVLAD